MNPGDILMYGHRTVLNTVQAFPSREWYTPGAVGYWSVKDVIAHLTSFEVPLVELLSSQVEACPTPNLETFIHRGADFNDLQVEQRREMSMEQVLAEYRQAYEQAAAAAAKIPAGIWERKGLLPWYGAQYDLEDFIVYSYYGHKREHCGQIQTFSDRFKQG